MNILKIFIFVDLIVGNNISYESVVVFDKLTNIIKRLNENIIDDLIWPDIHRLIIKYKPFLDIKNTKYKKILDNVFQ